MTQIIDRGFVFDTYKVLLILKLPVRISTLGFLLLFADKRSPLLMDGKKK